MENKKINNGKIYSLIKYEYLRWLINPRIAIFACMLIFIVNYMVDVMVNASNTMGEPLGVFELFIATANSEEMCIIMLAVFFILIGDFPRKDPNALLYVHRLGRLKWLVGQVVVSILIIATYLGTILLFLMAMSGKNPSWANEWSEVVTKYPVLYADEAEFDISKFISGRLYNNFTPYETLGYSFLLLFGLLLMLAMLKIVFFLLNKQTLGVLVVASLLVFSWAFSILDIKIKWLFPLSHAIGWQHCDMVFSTMTVTLEQSVIYFGVLSILSFIGSVFLVDKFDFGNTKGTT